MGRPLPSDLATHAHLGTKEVILGMPGPWAEENHEHSDHYTTKVGGLPDWAVAVEEVDKELLKCGVCRGELMLVAQVYAPVTINGIEMDERTLYIFGCPSSSCGVRPSSWRTLRVQSTFQNKIRDNSGGIGESSSSGVDDARRNESTEREEGNMVDSHSNGNEWWDNGNWDPEGVTSDDVEEGAFLAMNELEMALLEAGYTASAPSLASPNLGVEEEIVRAHGGATSESDLPVLPCFYVYPQHDSSPSGGCQAESAFESTAGDEEAGQGEVWEGEEYEHDRALSADRTYLKFKKRLDRYPEQCFRYQFKGKPLWACKEETEIGVCSHCSGPRVYEMQLMPPLIYYLQQACKDLPSSSCSPNAWEWLTLIVFSCAKSCTPGVNEYGEVKPWIVVEETILLQSEA